MCSSDLANGLRWYGHVLRRDDGHVLRKALEFEVKGKRKRGRPKKTWKTQVEKESKSVGLNRARWRVGVGEWELERWEMERMLLERSKSGHPHLQG